MKKQKMIRAFDMVDDDLLESADPSNAPVAKKKRISITWLSVAACLALAFLTLGLWLFIPYRTTPPSVSKYSESEYYSVIKKLNAVTYEKPKYKNNFDKYFSDNKDYDDGDRDGVIIGSEEYEEVTDNQVDGVIEGDRIKRSSEYIYYLDRNHTISVYSIAGDESQLVGSYSLKQSLRNAYFSSSRDEIYLSEDCTQITVVVPYSKSGPSGISCVSVVSLDVTDPANITEKDKITFSGSYISSRLVNGKLLLMTKFSVKTNPDFSKEEIFLPQITHINGNTNSISPYDIIAPDKLTSASYTVISKIDEKTLLIEDCSAILSFSDEMYVSKNNIFATREYTDNGLVNRKTLTEIVCVSYTGEGLEYKGSVTVDGAVKDQYSLDEHNGILRVVTTTSKTSFSDTNADLYCINISDFKILASVKAFAPEGETVCSVRFDGDDVYVCTAVKVAFNDPVFFFDLSDLNNITYKHTGDIPGYSDSLVNFGNGYLLGIGAGDTRRSFKIEVYEETENGVSSVCKYEMNAIWSELYKAYYINREMGFIGFGIYSYEHSERDRYILLYFDGYELRELVNVELSGGTYYPRGVYIDGYLYMFGDSEFKVVQVE